MNLIKMNCCGLLELHGLWDENPENILSGMGSIAYREWESTHWQGIVFSFRANSAPGLNLLAYIDEHDLGTVIQHLSENPNSGNTLVTGIWYTNWAKFEPWYQQHRYVATRGWRHSDTAEEHREDCNCYLCVCGSESIGRIIKVGE